MQGEREKLLKIEDKLHERVVGQDEAVRLVSDASAARAPGCRMKTGLTVPSCSLGPNRRR